MLEERREKIAQGLKNAERIKAELADAEKQKAEILAGANAEAQRMIEEARASAAAVAERKTQQAIAEAEQIVAKAHEATELEHARMLTELKREVGRLVLNTTTKVTGKVLTDDDQRRINEETVRKMPRDTDEKFEIRNSKFEGIGAGGAPDSGFTSIPSQKIQKRPAFFEFRISNFEFLTFNAHSG